MAETERVYWGIKADKIKHRCEYSYMVLDKTKRIAILGARGCDDSGGPLLYHTKKDAKEWCLYDESPIKLKITIEEA